MHVVVMFVNNSLSSLGHHTSLHKVVFNKSQKLNEFQPTVIVH